MPKKSTDPYHPPRPPGKLCWSLDYFGVYRIPRIALYQTGKDRFTSQYGLQVSKGLTYGQAAADLGGSIMHALACNSLLDNRMPGED